MIPISVPVLGTASTKGRYDGYQTLVRRVPKIGTSNTKHRYNEYPTPGMEHTRRWYNTIKG
ncbi:hypothetical protein KQ909_16300 [Bacteroides stercoris]|uniref:hypothetical protein n=1 Tax=Bacteroides stercoris TaxID=46506 RepID=UPI001C2D8CAE|nr:hypothetical protein [Bacteroides stercoris]MBV1681546.1 hypothetical protein [Bacteroides stercoris]